MLSPVEHVLRARAMPPLLPRAGLLLPTGFMVPKTYTLDLRLTTDHFAVKRGFAAPTTFSADAEATFEILQDTSCLLLHAQVRSSPMD